MRKHHARRTRSGTQPASHAAALTIPPDPATVPRMDTIKFLLGATCALLLVAVVASWQNMSKGVSNAPADEMDRFRKQIAELRAEQDNLKLEKQRIELRASIPPTPAPSPSAAELELLRLQLEEEKRALAELEQNSEASDKKLAMEEEGLMEQRKIEGRDSELRRARLIAEALLIGRIREYLEDAEIGSFITFEVLAPQGVSLEPGTIIAIRRKTGILNQYKIAEITAEGGIANPLPGFGDLKPEIGDELILPPPF